MLAVVIPARDEAARVENVLNQALRLPRALVIPVLNGCRDMTEEIVRRVQNARIRPLVFREALGYDVPRIAGAQAALEGGARGVIFVDGDLSGRLLGHLTLLGDAVRRGGLDLALSDCYASTPMPVRESAARRVYLARQALNQALDREDLGVAIPSHGPAAVSRRLLETVPLWSLGVPPVMQALAVRRGLEIGVAGHLPHKELGSARRDREHRLRVAETIIGDCLEAVCLARGLPPDRQGHDGYHSQRRFDRLQMDILKEDDLIRYTKE